MTWRAEDLDGHRFYRAELTRYGRRIALVVGPTTDGRWQARTGSPADSTREIAEGGSYLGTEPSPTRARGWAEGV